MIPQLLWCAVIGIAAKLSYHDAPFLAGIFAGSALVFAAISIGRRFASC